jgi:hypothetical protein
MEATPMYRTLILLWLTLVAGLAIYPSPSDAAAPVYRCDAFGYQLNIPAGWTVLTKDCTGNKTHLLQSNDATGLIVMEAVIEDRGLYFPDLVRTALVDVGSSGSNLTYDTLHVGGQTYSTATDTFTVSGTSTKLATYFLAVKHSGVLQVFSALVRVNDNPKATTELAAARASLTGIQLFNGTVDNRILYRTILFVIVTLALLTGSAVLLRRRQATSAQLVAWLFVAAIVTTVVSHIVTSWPIAGLDLAIKATFLGNLLAWPVLALITRLRTPAEPEWPAPTGI